VFGITQVDSEQGKWAVNTALNIISGNSMKEPHVEVNSITKRYFNQKLAERIHFRPKNEFIRQAEIIH
jgi:hypothetical protein